MEGETIQAQIAGNAYNDSPNPMAELVAFFIKIFWLILGIKLRIYIVATNLQIIETDKKTLLWWLLPGDTTVLTLNRNSVQSVGCAMATSWFIFRSFYFLLANTSGLI